MLLEEGVCYDQCEIISHISDGRRIHIEKSYYTWLLEIYTKMDKNYKAL